MSRSGRQAVVGLGAIAVVLVAVAVLASVSNSRKGLRVDVLSARRAEPGDPLAVTVSVRDTAGVLTGLVVDFGDGSPARRVSRTDCLGAAGGPSTESVDFDHAYPAGVYTIRARATTGCTDRSETAEAIRTVRIKQLRR